MGTTPRRLLVISVATIGILLIWQSLGDMYPTWALFVSTPTRLVSFAVENYIRLAKDFIYTLAVSFGGFAAACSIGLTAGVAAYRFPRIRHVAIRALQGVQVVPVLVFAPFVTILVGIGPLAHIVISFLVGVFPFVTIVVDSLVAMPSALIELIRLYKLPFGSVVVKVYLPYIAPAVFAAARVSATLCVVGTTVAEFTGSRHGLGRNVFEAAIRIEPEKMVFSTVGIIIIGLMYIAALRFAERRIINWQH